MGINANAARKTRFAAAGVLMAGWAVSAGVAGADPEPSPSPSPGPSPVAAPASPSSDPTPASPSPAASASPGAGPKTTIDKDGIYAVGSDIAPGIYSTAGPVGSGTCYWKRTSNPDGALIDNSLSKRSQVVQIEPTDKAFKTSGCQPWQLTPDAALPPSTPPAGAQTTLGILNGLLGGNGPQPPHP